MLKLEGTRICFCGRGKRWGLAYPLIEKKRPDVLITNIKMPFMDGLELARLVRRRCRASKLSY